MLKLFLLVSFCQQSETSLSFSASIEVLKEKQPGFWYITALKQNIMLLVGFNKMPLQLGLSLRNHPQSNATYRCPTRQFPGQNACDTLSAFCVLGVSVASGSLWPHGRSTPGFPILHCHPRFAQTFVPWVSDAIWLSYPLLPPSPPAFNLSQHQGLFQWVGSSHQVTKELELQLQHQSFQWIFRIDFL